MTICRFPYRSTGALLLGLTAGLLATPTHAAGRDWTDTGGTGLWGDSGNWQQGAVPLFTDQAMLGAVAPAGFALDLGGVNRPVDEIAFSGGTGFTLSNGTLQLVGRTITASGSATHVLNTLVGFNSDPFDPLPDNTTVDIGDTATVEFAGGIASGGFFTLNKTGAGTLLLSTANSFGVLTVINAGTVALSHPDALQNSTILINVDNGLDLTTHGVDANLDGISGSGDLNIGAQQVTIEIGDYAGVISGSGSLTKAAGGNLELVGANTYSGGTTIASGTLLANNTSGSATGSGAVRVLSGGTLGGMGTVSGGVTVEAGGGVSPGAAIGALQVAAAAFESFSTLEIEIGQDDDGPVVDQLSVLGHLSIASGAVLDLTLRNGLTPVAGDRFQVLDLQGTRAGAFESVLFPTLDPGLAWNLQDLYSAGDVRIELAGDLNTDGFVGAADLDILLANWGGAAALADFSAGDANGDGLVNDADLQIVIARFGTGTPPGTDVPEPGSLAVMALLGAAIRRRRRG